MHLIIGSLYTLKDFAPSPSGRSEAPRELFRELPALAGHRSTVARISTFSLHRMITQITM